MLNSVFIFVFISETSHPEIAFFIQSFSSFHSPLSDKHKCLTAMYYLQLHILTTYPTMLSIIYAKEMILHLNVMDVK